MNNDQENEYRGLVRGAATWVLLGKSDGVTDEADLARVYDLDVAKVRADVDAIIKSEHEKVDGVFEVKPAA
jgi:hypothetical protein